MGVCWPGPAAGSIIEKFHVGSELLHVDADLERFDVFVCKSKLGLALPTARPTFYHTR
jgi:hypothetical protein